MSNVSRMVYSFTYKWRETGGLCCASFITYEEAVKERKHVLNDKAFTEVSDICVDRLEM